MSPQRVAGGVRADYIALGRPSIPRRLIRVFDMANMHADSAAPPGTALVTGAADRIGAAIAVRLADAGYNVVVHYRTSPEQAERVCEKIGAAGGRAAAVQADLANRSERANLVRRAADVFGPLDVLVNNASAFQPDSAEDVEEALWDMHFAVHAEAPAFLGRDFYGQLPAGVEGNIVNIIDERVLTLSPAFFSYTLSKSVLWTATQTMAQSFAPRVRVNAIGPGPTLKNAHQSEEAFRRSLQVLPLGRGASAAEVAEGVMVLLQTRSMTGQMLALDGGKHLAFHEARGRTPRRR